MQDTGLKGTDYVLRAFGFTISDFGAILLGMLPWMLPLVAVGMWPVLDTDGYYGRILVAQSNFAASGNIHHGPTFTGWLFLLLLSGFQMTMLAGFAIQRHRRVLSLVIPMERSLTAAVAPYVGYWLATGFAAGFLGFLGGLVISLLSATTLQGAVPYLAIILMAGIGLLVLRGVLIFPAIAVGDRGMTIRVSFEVTSHSIWRMALSVILIAIPLILLTLVFSLIVGQLLPLHPWWRHVLVLTLGTQIIQFIGTAVFIAYISLVYAHKRGDGVPAPPDWDDSVEAKP